MLQVRVLPGAPDSPAIIAVAKMAGENLSLVMGA
jgi:hypothetical protein